MNNCHLFLSKHDPQDQYLTLFYGFLTSYFGVSLKKTCAVEILASRVNIFHIFFQ